MTLVYRMACQGVNRTGPMAVPGVQTIDFLEVLLVSRATEPIEHPVAGHATIGTTRQRLAIHGLTLICGVWMTFSPTLSQRLLQTDPGDTLLNHYVLEHSWRWISDRDYQFPLWSPGCFYPAENTLAYSENLLGAAPIYWLARTGVNELASFQFWMIAVVVLSYLSMAWVLTRLGVHAFLAALGAGAYAFGLPQTNQLCHQQLLPSMYCPLAVYWLWQFLCQPRLTRLAATLLMALLQLWSSVYLGWLLSLAMAAFALTAIMLIPNQRKPILEFVQTKWAAAFGLAALAWLCAWPLLGHYLEANRGFHRSYRHEVRELLPMPGSWLSPPPSSAWADYLNPVSGPLSHEHHLFPGAVFIVLLGGSVCIGTVRRELSPLAKVALVTMSVLMLLSMRFGKYSIWRQVYSIVPGAEGIRAVTRIYSVVLLMGWLGILVAISAWLRSRPRFAWMAGAVLLVIGLSEQYQPRLPAFEARPFFATADQLAGQMRGAQAAYVELDRSAPYWTGQLTAMWAGLKANVPVVNGYSGRVPAGYPDEKVCQTRLSLGPWLGEREVRLIPVLLPNGDGPRCPNTLTKQ